MIRLLAGLVSFLSIGFVVFVGGMAGLVHLYGQDLPSHDELVDYQPKMLSRVYSGEGEVIAQYARQKRIFAPIEEVPDLVKDAFISAEDKNFYAHPGVDMVGIAKAIGRFVQAKAKGRDPQLSGASTISQQVMKNFLVGNARSFERKIREAILAVRIDGALSKDQILELYLNEIYLGARSYGVMAAAQNYFGKTMEELTPPEAAYLAALPKAPSTYHPIKQRDRAVIRRNYVLEEMAQNGYLSRPDAERYKSEPLITLIDTDGPEVLANIEPNYFTAEVRRQLVNELGFDQVYEGGLTVRATIDQDLQREAARALRRGLEGYDRRTGFWQGPVARIEDLDPDLWRLQLADADVPRDIEGWSPAVVLSVGERTAEVGVEADPGEAATLSLAREKWLRTIQGESGRRVRIRSAADVWAIGDVVFVRKV
ncbi:MAG: transglycosylase domain-containing protein, partial [Pseudomonadota bacterium]